MPSKLITCARPGCSRQITQRKTWHRYCSSSCRSIVWKAKKLAQDMTDKVMEGVEGGATDNK